MGAAAVWAGDSTKVLQLYSNGLHVTPTYSKIQPSNGFIENPKHDPKPRGTCFYDRGVFWPLGACIIMETGPALKLAPWPGAGIYIYTHALYIYWNIYGRIGIVCCVQSSCNHVETIRSFAPGVLVLWRCRGEPRFLHRLPGWFLGGSGRASGRRCLEVGPVLFSKFAIINQLQIPSFLG